MSLCVGDWGRKPSTSRTVCTEPCTASKLTNARIRAGKKNDEKKLDNVRKRD